jgi:hypothetical protein
MVILIVVAITAGIFLLYVSFLNYASNHNMQKPPKLRIVKELDNGRFIIEQFHLFKLFGLEIIGEWRWIGDRSSRYGYCPTEYSSYEEAKKKIESQYKDFILVE